MEKKKSQSNEGQRLRDVKERKISQIIQWHKLGHVSQFKSDSQNDDV